MGDQRGPERMSFHEDVNLSFEEYDLLWSYLRKERIALLKFIDEFVKSAYRDNETFTELMEELKTLDTIVLKLEARFQH